MKIYNQLLKKTVDKLYIFIVNIPNANVFSKRDVLMYSFIIVSYSHIDSSA